MAIKNTSKNVKTVNKFSNNSLEIKKDFNLLQKFIWTLKKTIA